MQTPIKYFRSDAIFSFMVFPCRFLHVSLALSLSLPLTFVRHAHYCNVVLLVFASRRVYILCFLQDTQLSCGQFQFLFCCFTLVSGTTAVFCFSSTGVFSVGSSWRLPSSFLHVSLNLPALVSNVLFDGLRLFFPCMTSLPMGFLILTVTCCTSYSACSRNLEFF